MYAIVTDSCSDLNRELIAGFDALTILPMSYTISGETNTQAFYDEDIIKAFYDRLRAGENCTTAQVSPGEFYEAYKQLAEQGKQVLSIQFSSALSGTHSAACMAREMVLEEYPDAVIEVVDTLGASAGEGLMVYDALQNREAGMTILENAAWLRERVQNYVQWFTVDDLQFLKRGGRCSPSAAFFGSMLSIKPVLHVDESGKLIARQKVRGRHQALKALASKFGELNSAVDQVMFISHADCYGDAMFLKKQLVEGYGCSADKIILSNIGPVIGSHSGPGTVAFFFRGKDRG
ncbi:MAG: DegV family protein [Clostridia bacterium]|nr:DegV family protein [Clostridia bacterium]